MTMMKLYLVIYIGGLIGGSVGPLPYDEAECRARAAAMYAELDPAVVTEDGIKKSDVEYRCERRHQRPELQR